MWQLLKTSWRCWIQGFPSQFQMETLLFTASKMFFNSCQMVYLLQNEISVSTHDSQHTTKSCKTQSSLKRVENHAVDFKNYYDGNEMSDRCGTTFCTRWITMFTFETNLENPVMMCTFESILEDPVMYDVYNTSESVIACIAWSGRLY